jgi:hypothetical protein
MQCISRTKKKPQVNWKMKNESVIYHTHQLCTDIGVALHFISETHVVVWMLTDPVEAGMKLN